MDGTLVVALIGAAATIVAALIGLLRGRQEGYDKGEARGTERGYAAGQERGKSEGYAQGLEEGRREGRELGRAAGLEAGMAEGRRAGFEEGQKHSLVRFLAVHQRNIEAAIASLERADFDTVRASSVAIVETVQTWRGIQRALEKLLNGLVDSLARALATGNEYEIAIAVRALMIAFPAQRLAVETELQRTSI